MTVTVDIRDDPDRPEGGHALVLFRNTSGPVGRGTLCVEPLTENYTYSGPREIEVHASRAPEGLMVPVGDGALDQLDPGIAVRLSLSGADVEAETLWPSLTPRPRLAKRRVPMASGRKREVVDAASGGTPRAKARFVDDSDGAPIDGALNKGEKSVDRSTSPLDVSVPKSLEPDVVPKNDVPPPKPPNLPELDKGETSQEAKGGTEPPSSEPIVDLPAQKAAKRGASGLLVTGVAVLAFALGAAASFGLHLALDKPQVVSMPPRALPPVLSLPSLYASLADLPQVSPEGTRVDGRNWRAFLTRSRSAKTSEERSFWRKWAMRTVLEERSNGAATALVDFATDLVGSRSDDATLAAARMLWELAAVAGDCGAMSNIAKTLTKTENATDQGLWNDRARRCLGGRPRP